MSNITKPHLVIVGAGVIGLTTALLALESGKYEVTVVARDLPGDEKCVGYTSPWAGGSNAKVGRLFYADKPDGILCRGKDGRGRMPYWDAELSTLFRKPPQEKTRVDPPGPNSYAAITIDTSKYLPCLVAEIRRLGCTIIRTNVTHVSQLQSPIIPRKADVVVVCAGLGARHLGGVEDWDCYPIRGQVVLVRAPWYKRGVTKSSKTGDWTYTIPRASGDVILGGFKTDNDWTAHAIPSQTTDILERCIAMAPDLIPVTKSRDRDPKVLVEELRKLVVEEGAGLRPARKGGVRIESEDLVLGGAGNEVIPLVHHYGHSGAGYQASFGSARLCMEEVARRLSAKDTRRQAKL
ncbi:hypothetical protein QFC22_001828 [Naganishia vaughanmartiniae]|uniref:Uncharacterized protein n=1 Tax=Naganishia vaughanmartiniae TaxID=1424756 RepID=A0ACC2XFN4_9TREE|nr:hypothetical protein QFC22_001828 [Naganishia vaughanmartiniae]